MYDQVAAQKLADANAAIQNWQKSGVLVDMIAGGLSGPTSTGAAGTIANAAAPALQYAVGQYFKGQKAEGSTAHIVAHTVLAAAVAAAGGNDALTAGLSAGGAELLAPKVANWLFGNTAGVEKDENGNVIASKLTAEQKQTVSNIVSLGAAGFTAGVGGAGADVVSNSQLASSALEDNYFSDQMVATFNAKTDLYKIVQGDPKSLANLNMTPQQREKIMETFTKESHALNVSMIDACSQFLPICGDMIAQAQRSQNWIADLKKYGFIRQNADFGRETAQAIQAVGIIYNQASKNAFELYNKPLSALNKEQKLTAFQYGEHSPKGMALQADRLKKISEQAPGWSSSELKNDTKALTPKQKDKLDKLPVRATAAIALIPSAAEAVGGAVATAASVGDCIGGSHVVGCATTASGAAVTAQGIDNTWHSAQALWTGIPSVTWGERALQALGATPTQAALGYAAANIGSGAGLAKLYGINQVVKSENAALQAEIKAARIENGVNTDNDLLSTSLNREVFRGTISEISNHDVLYSILMRGKVQLKDGVTAENVFANVLQKPTGQRPNPNTYLSQQYIDKQLSKFDDGVVKIMGQQQYDKYGIAQTDGTSFVLPKSEVKQIIKSANGDANVISTKLGIPKEQLQNGQIIIVDIPITKTSNLRIPSGNEAGANSQWLPGGALPNGNAEAVIDARMIPSSSLKTTPLIIK